MAKKYAVDQVFGDRPKVLCVDFDGVLHEYSSGWVNDHTILDGPVLGAMEWLVHCLLDGFEVCIYSSRSRSWRGRRATRQWLRKYLPEDRLREIKFPTKKPIAYLTIDDRAVCFNGTFPSKEEMLGFVPWNRRKDLGKAPTREEAEVRQLEDVHVKLMYQFFCPKCGVNRDGLLSDHNYSWSCPKCGRGNYSYREVLVYEHVKHSTFGAAYRNSTANFIGTVEDAIAASRKNPGERIEIKPGALCKPIPHVPTAEDLRPDIGELSSYIRVVRNGCEIIHGHEFVVMTKEKYDNMRQDIISSELDKAPGDRQLCQGCSLLAEEHLVDSDETFHGE